MPGRHRGRHGDYLRRDWKRLFVSLIAIDKAPPSIDAVHAVNAPCRHPCYSQPDAELGYSNAEVSTIQTCCGARPATLSNVRAIFLATAERETSR